MSKLTLSCFLFATMFFTGCHTLAHSHGEANHGAVASSETSIGVAAPAFAGTDTSGKTHRLSDYKGKFVVLEWFNPECPAVRPHYANNAMQNLQRAYTGMGVIWLTIDSSAPGKQGHLTPDQGKAVLKERNAAPTALILDSDGKIGRTFGAKTTPHMFVIDPGGKLIYAGAIDDRNGKNFVQAALDEALAGKPVSVPATQSYGCSVKY